MSDSKQPSLNILFSSYPQCSINGVAAISHTSTLELLTKRLPRDVPRGRLITHQTIDSVFRAAAQRRGEPEDTPRVFVRNARAGSGPRAKSGYTLSEIVAVIWDQIVYEFEKSMAMRQRPQTSAARAHNILKRKAAEIEDMHEYVDPVMAIDHVAVNDLRHSMRGRKGSSDVFSRRTTHTIWPTNNDDFTSCGKFIASGLPATQSVGFLEPMSVDDVVAEINEMCLAAHGVSIDTEHIRAIVAPMCQVVEPTKFLAHTVLRTSCMAECLGSTLSGHMPGFMHSRTFDLAPIDSGADITSALLRELVDTRKTLNKYKTFAVQGAYHSLTTLAGHRSVSASSWADDHISTAKDESMRTAHAMLEYQTRLNVAFKHVRETVSEALTVINIAKGAASDAQSEAESALNSLASERNLRRYLGPLEHAIDLYMADKVMKV